MSESRVSTPPARPRIERLQPWLAALVSALLHVLMLAILMWAKPPPVFTDPQGAASGGRIRVDFIGQPQPDPPQPEELQATPPPLPPAPVRRLDPQELLDPDRLLLAADPDPQPEQPEPRPQPVPQPPAQRTAQAEAAPARSPLRQPPHPWNGRPPGMVEETTTEFDDGRNGGMANSEGRRDQPNAGSQVMDVGGYQVIYELLAEQTLRDWMEQGMTELAIPLPGTRQRMVCPAEVALRREGSKCRMVDPASPEMIGIGDAREVISVRYVYHLGELVWRGPGPYR